MQTTRGTYHTRHDGGGILHLKCINCLEETMGRHPELAARVQKAVNVFHLPHETKKMEHTM